MLAKLADVIGSGNDEQTGCWADSWETFLVFAAMGTQINVGFNGVIGLRYEALPMVLELHGIAPDDRRYIFDGLREMERAAVAEINKR